MVKYGRAPMESSAERLSQYVWGSQDGGGHEADERSPSNTQQSGTDRPPSHSGKISPLPPRTKGLRRGLSLDGLPQEELGDVTPEVGEGEPSLKQIMEAICTCQATLTEHIDGIRAEMSFLKNDVQTIRERATEAEQRIGDLEDVVRPLEHKVQNIDCENAHTDKLGDMEDCRRRNNIRLVGFPEKAEGKQPEDFLEMCLKDNMADDTFSHLFAIERAHRVPSKKATLPHIILDVNHPDM